MKRGNTEISLGTAEEIFREDVLDLFLQNSISSDRLARLAGKAQRAGAKGIGDIVEKACSTKPHRSLARLAQRGSRWPPAYTLTLPGKTMHHSEEKECKLEVLLPHEVLLQMSCFTDMDKIFAQQRLALLKRPDLQQLLVRHNLSADETLILSIWQDGTPFNSDRSHTLELWILSILGAGDLRMPMACWPKELQLKGKTADSYFQLLGWSLRCCLLGKMPTARHDGQAWQQCDGWRSKRQGKVFGFQAILGEFRGDWSMLKSILGLPGWGDGTGICWKCSCCKEDLAKVGPEAFWRQESFSQQDFFARQRPIGPFFNLPMVSVDTIKIDFLHTADLGTTPDFLANLFYDITMRRMRGPGLSKHESRCDEFFKSYIQPYYRTNNIDSRLPCLRPSMLKKENKKTFKLRAKAGEARRLFPWCRTWCTRSLSRMNPMIAWSLQLAKVCINFMLAFHTNTGILS